MAMLVINGHDYSNRVIAGSHNVVKEDVGTSWTDGNFKNHMEVSRQRVTGSWDMYFKSMAEYDTFLADIYAVKVSGYIPMTVKVNNLPSDESEVEINALMEIAPVRNRNGKWEDFMERFTVTIEEA